MRLLISLALVTLANLAWQTRPLESGAIDPIDLAEGSTIAPDMLAGVEAECVLYVFFEPDCPWCGRVADAHAEMGGTTVETRWITDDPIDGLEFGHRLPGDAEVLLSKDLFRVFGVKAVPAAAWIRGGELVASGTLGGHETDEALLAPCSAEAPTGAGTI